MTRDELSHGSQPASLGHGVGFTVSRGTCGNAPSLLNDSVEITRGYYRRCSSRGRHVLVVCLTDASSAARRLQRPVRPPARDIRRDELIESVKRSTTRTAQIKALLECRGTGSFIPNRPQ